MPTFSKTSLKMFFGKIQDSLHCKLLSKIFLKFIGHQKANLIELVREEDVENSK